MNFTDTLKNVPSWFVLTILFLCVLVAYYIRPDPVSQDILKGIIGALLLSLQPKSTQQSTPSLPPQPQPV